MSPVGPTTSRSGALWSSDLMLRSAPAFDFPLQSIILGGKTSSQPQQPGKASPMAKLRHIALIVPDPEASAKFFEAAFDLKRAGTARRGIYLSDGVMNVALLKQEGNEKVGLYHFGMWVDDLDEAEKKVMDAGGTYLEGRPTSPNSYYEAKYRDPLGIVFDLTHKGWIGATKDVVAKS
jgi:lactoylglutathione lyase